MGTEHHESVRSIGQLLKARFVLHLDVEVQAGIARKAVDDDLPEAVVVEIGRTEGAKAALLQSAAVEPIGGAETGR